MSRVAVGVGVAFAELCVLTCKTEKLTVLSQQNKRNANEPIKEQKNMGEAAQSNNRLAAQQE